MLGMDLEMIKAAFSFQRQQKPIDMNFNTVKASADWAASTLKERSILLKK
jgi:hypothetical protein